MHGLRRELRGLQRTLCRLQRLRSKKELTEMGNSTGSMFYMAAAFIVIYAVGVALYEGCRFFRRWQERRRDRRFTDQEK